MRRVNINNPSFLQELLCERGLEVSIEICEGCLYAVEDNRFILQLVNDTFRLVKDASFEYKIDLVKCLEDVETYHVNKVKIEVSDAMNLYLKYLQEEQRFYILTDTYGVDKLTEFANENNINYKLANSVIEYLPNEMTRHYLNHSTADDMNRCLINHYCQNNNVNDTTFKVEMMRKMCDVINSNEEEVINSSISQLKDLFRPIEK